MIKGGYKASLMLFLQSYKKGLTVVKIKMGLLGLDGLVYKQRELHLCNGWRFA